jgi:hypothetical protein
MEKLGLAPNVTVLTPDAAAPSPRTSEDKTLAISGHFTVASRKRHAAD